MLRRAGYPASGSLAARSYLDYGEVIKPDDAKRSDPAVFKRGTASSQGHVGDLLKIDANTVWVIGGNQSLKGTDGAVTITALPRTSLLSVKRPTAADRVPAGTVPLRPSPGRPLRPPPRRRSRHRWWRRYSRPLSTRATTRWVSLVGKDPMALWDRIKGNPPKK